MQESEAEQKRVWRQFWRQGKTWDEWDALCQVQMEALQRVVTDFTGLKILEAGSGTGRVSRKLAEQGARVVLLDFVLDALYRSKAEKPQVVATSVCGSIFALPFADGSFDIVWNGGVLEHYDEGEQQAALREMVRVCRRGGMVITMNPYRKALFYRIAKRYLMLRKKWRYGKEEPLLTVTPLVPPEAQLIAEFDVGREIHLRWLGSLDFLPRPFRRPETNPTIYRWLHARVCGYLLVSVLRKL